MNKIRRAILFYQQIEGMDLSWIDVLERELTESTKSRIERSNLDLHVLARLIKLTMNEDRNEIDQVLNAKLHDQDLVIGIMRDLG